MFGRNIDLGNPVADHPLNQGLVSWWLPLPGSSGGSRFRDLCMRNPGTLNGPSWRSGPGQFQALSFDGSDDSVDIASSSNLSLPGNFTLSAVVRATTISGSHRTILRRDSGGGGAAGYWLLRLENTGAIGFYVSYYGSVTSGTLSTNKWYHLVIARSGGTVYHYVDGVLFYSSGGVAGNGTNTYQLQIGRFGTFEPWNGVITDVRIYPNRWLSASDAWLLYDQSLRGHPDTLRRYTPATYLVLADTLPPPDPPAPVATPGYRMIVNPKFPGRKGWY